MFIILNDNNDKMDNKGVQNAQYDSQSQDHVEDHNLCFIHKATQDKALGFSKTQTSDMYGLGVEMVRRPRPHTYITAKYNVTQYYEQAVELT